MIVCQEDGCFEKTHSDSGLCKRHCQRCRCEELAEAIKALQFYADHKNWFDRQQMEINGKPYEATVIGCDRGTIAANALEKIKV